MVNESAGLGNRTTAFSYTPPAGSSELADGFVYSTTDAEGRVTAFCHGVGTAGTVIGVAQALAILPGVSRSGLTITTAVCRAWYANGQALPPGFYEQHRQALALLERRMGRKLGDPADPLLVSVRSGARVSMPGMMDTVLNLGLNDRSVRGLADRTSNPRFAWDCYRRFMQMFGSVVLGLDLKGIAVSAGSACTSGNVEPSYVLVAMGVPVEWAMGAVRHSLGRGTTAEDIDAVVDNVEPIVRKLREELPAGARPGGTRAETPVSR